MPREAGFVVYEPWNDRPIILRIRDVAFNLSTESAENLLLALTEVLEVARKEKV